MLLTVFVCYSSSVSADSECDFEVNNICYNYILGAENEVAVTYRWYEYEYGEGWWSCHYTGTVSIPSSVTYNGITYKVTTVGNNAFRECYSLSSVSLPNTITTIGDYAFCDCSQLYTISLPQEVTSIGNGAFTGCINLNSVNNLNNVTSIGASAFADCRNLYSIIIPNTVEVIGANAFSGTGWYNSQPNGLVYAGKVAYKYKGEMPEGTSITLQEGTVGIADNALINCTNLTSLTIPSSMKRIGSSAFKNCSGLKSVTIPNSVTSIGSDAFYGCTNLTDIYIPNSVTSIGSYALQNTAWLNNQPDGLIYAGKVVYKYKGVMPSNTNIILQDGTASITDYAFYGCSGLTSILFANSETNIGSYAFYGCTGLTSVTIPSGVTNIGSYAFYNCSNLTSLTIPSSVTTIGNWAFYYCSNMTSVTAMMEKPVRIDFYTFSTNRTNATLYVPYGCKAAYEVADNWKDFKEIVEVMFSTDISHLDNVIYIEPTEGRCGSQTTLSVKMKNNVAIQTVQFDLYLPDGITIVPNEDGELVTASKERINKFNYFESSMQSDGALRLLAQATTTNVPVGDGEICRIVVDIPESMEEGDYPLVIKDALMVEKDNTSHSPDPNLVQTKLTVLNYVPGDASNDGEVNAIDFNMIGNYILGQSQSGFNAKAADISGDGDVNAIDFNMVGNMILNGATASASRKKDELSKEAQ